MSNIKDMPITMVLLLIFQCIGLGVRTNGQSQVNKRTIFWDRWVTEFSKVWGSVPAPSVRRSSGVNGKELLMKRANARSRGLLASRSPLISLECVIEEGRNSPDNWNCENREFFWLFILRSRQWELNRALGFIVRYSYVTMGGAVAL